MERIDLGLFLQPEIRCDTYIGPNMKAVWYAELEMLDLFIKICNKHNLTYQLVGGSLIGAMRHKGFIPWDDDIDVGMLRTDFDRFVELAKLELPYPFFLQTSANDEGRNIDYVQIRNSETTAIDLRYVEEKPLYNQGIFIDIFPIDGVGTEESLKKQYETISRLRKIYSNAYKKNTQGKAYIKHIISEGILRVIGNNRFRQMRENVFRKNTIEECSEVGLVSFLFNNNRRNYWDKEWIQQTMEVPFEYLTVNVPIMFDKVLSKTYGKWKVFEKGAAMHGGIDFQPTQRYKAVLHEKYGYKEFEDEYSRVPLKERKDKIQISDQCMLVPLSMEDGSYIFEMLQHIGSSENDFRNEVKGMDPTLFPQWLHEQYDAANGYNLPENYVPQSIYWLYVNEKPVGFGKIRWGLTAASREAGGNIGYAISTEYRGKGYGTILFQTLIKIAKNGNCPEILATVTKYNEASKVVMEKSSGTLIRENNARWYYQF